MRLKSLRLAVSHTYLNKKMDEFGQNHDQSLKKLMEIDTQLLRQKIQRKQRDQQLSGKLQC